jgi:hypothetical protein
LRGLEPPYGAVEQELADRSAQTNEAERKRTVREVAREIGEFMRENDRPLTSSGSDLGRVLINRLAMSAFVPCHLAPAWQAPNAIR